MKHKLIAVLFLFQLSACSEFIAEPDLQENWKTLETDNILLHYRPADFIPGPSPTIEQAETILANQQFYYQLIQDSINRIFNDQVAIYLFNEAEAKNHIGTNGGGHSIPKLNTFYFTFLNHERDYTDRYGIENPVLGAHEMVHVITHRTLGYPGTKLMSEGYANWLDGSYAHYHLEDILKSYLEEHPEKILTPDQMLDERDITESVYYPNVGVFLRFMAGRYGIEKVNQLFTVSKEKFRSEFERTCNESWQEMSRDFEEYIVSMK